MGYGYFENTENGTSGAWIKILRPLFNTNTPLKPPFRHFGNHFGPPKSDFWPFYIFGHFPIEIPIETEKIQNSHFPGSKCSTLTYLFSGSKMQPGTAMCFLRKPLWNFPIDMWTPLVHILQRMTRRRWKLLIGFLITAPLLLLLLYVRRQQNHGDQNNLPD